MEPRLSLSDNVFCCEVDGAYVVLDAARNKYLAFTDKQAAWFDDVRSRKRLDRLSVDGRRFTDRLIELGILGLHKGQLNSLDAAMYAPANGSTYDFLSTSKWTTTIIRIPTFLRAVQCAYRCTRSKSILRSLSHVRRWQLRAESSGPHSVQNASSLSRQFHTLAPYFFTMKDACLFRSIALVRFLSLHGLSGELYFGVRLCPFTAHCWVEIGGIVLNDDLENIAGYTKIMAVRQGTVQ